MKYFLCKADLEDGIRYYELIIKGIDDTEAQLIFCNYVKNDYPDYVEAHNGIENMDIYIHELTIGFIISEAFGKELLGKKENE
jgi:hypothetical protein